MKIRHIFEYLLFSFTAAIVLLLPLRTARRVGAVLGEITYSVVGYRRRVTLENLRHAFPEKTEQERDEIARGAFRNVGIAFFELLWFPRLNLDDVRRLVKFENPEFAREVHKRGKGMLVLTAHFGNWELMGQAFLAWTGIPVTIIVKTQANPLVDRSINRRRTRLGNSVVPMGLSVREVLRALRNGEAVGIVADQSAPRENIAVEFFGRMVPTHQGPAALSIKTGAPIIATFGVRQPDGSYLARFEEIETGDRGALSEDALRALTERHVMVTETVIRKHPDHWMWMHKRWKHVPVASDDAVPTGT